MSYILDALRKAEAERERGSVPNIHAQPNFAGAPARGARPKSRVWIAVAVVGVLLVVAAALPWFWMAGRNAAPVSTAALPAPAPAPMMAPAPAPVPAAMPAPATVAATVAATTAPAPTPTPPVVAAPTPVPVRKPKPAPVPASAAPASAAAPAAEERVYAMSELPDDIRRQLPGLTVGGSMYSTTPASRLVIINGQVLHEGERLTPELVLQQIRLKAAVFAFKGYRFTITF